MLLEVNAANHRRKDAERSGAFLRPGGFALLGIVDLLRSLSWFVVLSPCKDLVTKIVDSRLGALLRRNRATQFPFSSLLN
ncbi:hypothetical protein DESC_190155 [Desulfosarcina cetonica]|nr:hypothetical protein DESC_190155 [Desulfosarcina cetonica]